MRSKLVEPKVEKLLQESQDYRDSDKKLIIAYLERFDGVQLSESQKRAILNSTPFESITRARRALKEKYPASKKVTQKRFDNFQEERRDHSNWSFPWRS